MRTALRYAHFGRCQIRKRPITIACPAPWGIHVRFGTHHKKRPQAIIAHINHINLISGVKTATIISRGCQEICSHVGGAVPRVMWGGGLDIAGNVISISDEDCGCGLRTVDRTLGYVRACYCNIFICCHLFYSFLLFHLLQSVAPNLQYLPFPMKAGLHCGMNQTLGWNYSNLKSITFRVPQGGD